MHVRVNIYRGYFSISWIEINYIFLELFESHATEMKTAKKAEIFNWWENLVFHLNWRKNLEIETSIVWGENM